MMKIRISSKSRCYTGLPGTAKSTKIDRIVEKESEELLNREILYLIFHRFKKEEKIKSKKYYNEDNTFTLH